MATLDLKAPFWRYRGGSKTHLLIGSSCLGSDLIRNNGGLTACAGTQLIWMPGKLLWGQRGCALLFRSLIYDTYLPSNSSTDTLMLVPEYYLFLRYSISSFKSIKWSAGLILPLMLVYLWSPLSVKACHMAPPYYSLRHHRCPGLLWLYRRTAVCQGTPESLMAPDWR